jgi:hypothetical protein
MAKFVELTENEELKDVENLEETEMAEKEHSVVVKKFFGGVKENAGKIIGCVAGAALLIVGAVVIVGKVAGSKDTENTESESTESEGSVDIVSTANPVDLQSEQSNS